jgi:phosphoribosylglycinamide formyltransferase 1
MARIAVLASGRGSNFQSIIDGIECGFIPKSKIVLAISDKADAYALERARKHNIEALHLDPKGFASREDYDLRIAQELRKRKVDLVLLAGYMRIVTPALLKDFKNAVMNIHPAILPSFPGLHAQKQALDWGAKASGCTVHYVDAQVDHGPIIIQAAVPIEEGDSEETLSARILRQEHKIYPQAVKWHVEGKLKVEGRAVTVLKSKPRGRVLLGR